VNFPCFRHPIFSKILPAALKNKEIWLLGLPKFSENTGYFQHSDHWKLHDFNKIPIRHPNIPDFLIRIQGFPRILIAFSRQRREKSRDRKIENQSLIFPEISLISLNPRYSSNSSNILLNP